MCSETCVGRLRYLGIVLYDPDAVAQAASVPDDELYEAQLDLLLDPRDPEVIALAKAGGMPDDWIAAAQRSPIYALIKHFKVALPLHPEYRTLPMVWYIPPLSPVTDLLRDQGHDAEAAGNLFGAIDALRIPVTYLAELFTAGDTAIVTGVLQKLAAMRSYMRGVTIGTGRDPELAAAVRMTPEAREQMYRLRARAKYSDRYVIPTAHREEAHNLEELACSLDFEGGPGMYESGPFGEASGRPVPVAIETYSALKARQKAEEAASQATLANRPGMLNWDANEDTP